MKINHLFKTLILMTLLTSSAIAAPTKKHLLEKDYSNAWCSANGGMSEYVLPDKTRVDCLTPEYAVETEFAHKWAESVGQCLYYSKMTGKKPAVAIILKKPTDYRYIRRINKAHKNITIFKIQAY